jgi:hypothetical protein
MLATVGCRACNAEQTCHWQFWASLCGFQVIWKILWTPRNLANILTTHGFSVSMNECHVVGRHAI